MLGKFLSCDSLSKVKIINDARPEKNLAMQASQAQPLLLSIQFYLCPSKHRVSSTGLASTRASVVATITVPIKPESKEVAKSPSTQPEVYFCRLFLYKVLTIQLNYAR